MGLRARLPGRRLRSVHNIYMFLSLGKHDLLCSEILETYLIRRFFEILNLVVGGSFLVTRSESLRLHVQAYYFTELRIARGIVGADLWLIR